MRMFQCIRPTADMETNEMRILQNILLTISNKDETIVSLNYSKNMMLMTLVILGNHNYCRPHSGLPNQITPAVAAGIDLKLGNNRLGDLIIKSAEVKDRTKKECSIKPQLRKKSRIHRYQKRSGLHFSKAKRMVT